MLLTFRANIFTPAKGLWSLSGSNLVNLDQDRVFLNPLGLRGFN